MRIIDGGLTKNDKTATFTALKIYREGSEFGPVRYSIGYAFRGGNKDAMLQLHSSETPDAQPCSYHYFYHDYVNIVSDSDSFHFFYFYSVILSQYLLLCLSRIELGHS